jgi:hypothetical protein
LESEGFLARGQERQETLLRERVQPAEQEVQGELAERSTLVVL